MSVTHAAATRNNIADAVLADIDQNASAAYIEFRTSGDVEVATLTCSDPAGTVSGAVLTFGTIASDTNATGGTIAKAAIIEGGGTDVLNCAVGTSGSDINLSSLSVTAGDTVALTSLTYTAPV